MIGHSLVNGAHQVRVGIGQLEAEASTGVGPGMSDFLHPLAQADQHHTVSRSRFARRAVVDPAV